MDTSLVSAFIIYFGALISIGVYFYYKNNNAKSYTLGNRSLNYWVTAISAQSSDMGAWLFMAYPAMIFSKGILEIWTAVGLVICMYFNWKLIAPKLRAQTEHYQTMTLPSYLAKRFKDDNDTIKIVSALVSAFFFTCYISAGLVGLGVLFESTFNMSYFTGIAISLGVTLVYTLLGGFLAVSWCNLFQGIFLLATIILVPAYGLSAVGGIAGLQSIALVKNYSLNIIPSAAALKDIFMLVTGFGLGTFGQVHILVNFMGINDVRKVKKAMMVGLTWQIIVLACAASIGVVGVAFFANGITNNEHLFVLMAKSLFPAFVAGLVLCGMLAAALSTINTQLIVTASSLATDLYPSKPENQLLISRIATIAVAAISVAISLQNSLSIYNLVQYAWSGLGCSFGPVVIAALYSKKINKYGAIVGMISGAIAAGIWPLLNFSIPALSIIFPASFLVMRFVSAATYSSATHAK